MKAVGRPQKWTKMWRSGRKSVGARYPSFWTCFPLMFFAKNFTRLAETLSFSVQFSILVFLFWPCISVFKTILYYHVENIFLPLQFGNVVVEILIENWRQILCGEPPRYTSRGPPSRQTSGTSLVGQHQHPGQQGGPPLHLHHHHPHQLSSSSFNLSGHSVGGSPGGGGLPRPPQPPPYLPPPPPGSSTSSLATLPSTVTLPATSLMSANGIKV